MHNDTASGPINSPVSNYYNYNFISPDPLYAEIKEEMKSYFATGIIDDTMFAANTEKALRKLGRSGYKIEEVVLELDGYQASLPEDFQSVRELWLCTNVAQHLTLPSFIYEASTCTIQLPTSPTGSNEPDNEACALGYQVLHKTSRQVLLSFRRHALLRPGNLHAVGYCSARQQEFVPYSNHVFDVRDCRIITTVPHGWLHLVYYKHEKDESEQQLIPDNYAIGEYIKAFLKYKCYEQLYNEVTDESFNQIERKYLNYKQEYLEAYLVADAEIKKQTLYQKISAIKKMRTDLQAYYIR